MKKAKVSFDEFTEVLTITVPIYSQWVVEYQVWTSRPSKEVEVRKYDTSKPRPEGPQIFLPREALIEFGLLNIGDYLGSMTIKTLRECLKRDNRCAPSLLCK